MERSNRARAPDQFVGPPEHRLQHVVTGIESRARTVVTAPSRSVTTRIVWRPSSWTSTAVRATGPAGPANLTVTDGWTPTVIDVSVSIVSVVGVAARTVGGPRSHAAVRARHIASRTDERATRLPRSPPPIAITTVPAAMTTASP